MTSISTLRWVRSSIDRWSAVGSLVTLQACSGADSRTQIEPAQPRLAPAAAIDGAARAAVAAAPTAQVIARDREGNGRVLVAPSSSAAPAMPTQMDSESAARLNLARYAAELGVNDATLRDAVLDASHLLPGGAAILQFSQRSHGLPVFHARASVLIDAHKNLVSMSNSLAPASVGAPKSISFALPSEMALATAYTAMSGTSLSAGAVHDDATRDEGWHDFSVTTGSAATRVLDASARRVLFRDAGALVPSYHIELLTRAANSGENVGRAYVISASDARVLWQASLSANDAFSYRVWAEPSGNHLPNDGPIVDSSPHPTGVPDALLPAFTSPIVVQMEGFNKNLSGVADPWLKPTDTYSFGNNVHAYSDRDEVTTDAGVMKLDGFDSQDYRAEVTSTETFDRTFDTSKAPDVTTDQIKAAITQVFYVTNWMHDYWYDSGFDEKSHNAQLSNYGRGGTENDPLHAEAQDSASSGESNNANMFAPSDGKSPRMQMYVWSGVPNRTLVTAPPTATPDGLGAATFGPQTFDIEQAGLTLVLANDGSTVIPPSSTPTSPSTVTVGTSSDACQRPANVSGKIAVIDRGACLFTDKISNAQAAGAVGVLLLDNAPGHVPPSPGSTITTITIPVLSLSYEDGQTLKSNLAGNVSVTSFTRGAETMRDGTIDNTVVAHEWGHYLHHRLVLCGSTSCDGMSEGWADFNALLMVIHDGDTFPGKVYALAQYAAAGLLNSAAYYGIRRAPYSVELTKNPFTFTDVRAASTLPTTAPLAPASPDMNEVHNVGEIWASMLFEGYVNLLAAGQSAGRSFDDSKRRMADYVVAGMKATPVEPTFVEQRDAILSTVRAMAVTDPTRQADFTALAQGFAKRGLGSGAIAPPTSSTTLNEAVESFSVQGNLEFSSATLDDSTSSCDNDGVLDAGESGLLKLKLRNTGWAALTQSTVKVSSSDAAITFDNGGMATLGPIDPYQEVIADIGVTATGTTSKPGTVHLTITPSDPQSLVPSSDIALQLAYNYDDKSNASASDNFEGDKTAWLTASASGDVLPVWSRQGDASNHVWHADDIGTISDEALLSPDLQVSAAYPLTISFKQRYSFETGAVSQDGPDVAFDGGVLEISSDGGNTWQDISSYSYATGYTATLYAEPVDAGTPDTGDNNPLAGRRAWAGESIGYPSYTTTSINLGQRFAGKTIKLRFRVGTDAEGGAPGWDIDNLSFNGSITNTPFDAVVDNACVAK